MNRVRVGGQALVALIIFALITPSAEAARCEVDPWLNEVVTQSDRVIADIEETSRALDARAQRVLEACGGCTGDWVATYYRAVVAGSLIGSYGIWQAYQLSHLNLRGAELSERLSRIAPESAEAAYLRRLNLGNTKVRLRSQRQALASLAGVVLTYVASYLSLESYEDTKSFEIQGRPGQVLSLKDEGAHLVVKLLRGTSSPGPLTTALLSDIFLQNLERLRAELDRRHVAIELARGPDPTLTGQVEEPVAREHLRKFRQEQIMLEAAAETLRLERDGAMAICRAFTDAS